MDVIDRSIYSMKMNIIKCDLEVARQHCEWAFGRATNHDFKCTNNKNQVLIMYNKSVKKTIASNPNPGIGIKLRIRMLL